jgi:hypothetical protein
MAVFSTLLLSPQISFEFSLLHLKNVPKCEDRRERKEVE